MNKKELRIVVAHPDQQHSFKTAIALQNEGILYKYITTVYNKPQSLTNLAQKLAGGTFRAKLKQHYSTEIEDKNVKQFCQFLSILMPLVFRIDRKKEFYTKLENLRNKLFCKKVVRYCKRNDVDGVIMFDTTASNAFILMDKKGLKTKKIIDMSAPYRPYMKQIFENEAKKHGGNSTLPGIISSYRYQNWMKHSETEFALADAYLVASDFSAESLLSFGADKSKIYKCIYGMDTSFFNASERVIRRDDEKLECVFVGNINEQKGIYYFLEAAKRLGKDKFNFTLIGAYDKENPLLKSYDGLCNYTGHIVKTELRSILNKSDVIVFPSLADGFGFAVLEAMACGVIPICSTNAGVSCLVKDGENGFLVSAGNDREIYEKLININENRNEIPRMSENAVKTAMETTWDGYYEDVLSAVYKTFGLE